jgi:hypothetical protein
VAGGALGAGDAAGGATAAGGAARGPAGGAAGSAVAAASGAATTAATCALSAVVSTGRAAITAAFATGAAPPDARAEILPKYSKVVKLANDMIKHPKKLADAKNLVAAIELGAIPSNPVYALYSAVVGLAEAQPVMNACAPHPQPRKVVEEMLSESLDQFDRSGMSVWYEQTQNILKLSAAEATPIRETRTKRKRKFESAGGRSERKPFAKKENAAPLEPARQW